MSIFRRPLASVPVEARSITFNQWVTAASGSGVVTESSASTTTGALRQATVYRCTTLVSGTISTFPVHAKRGRATINPTPSILARPSADMRRSVWVGAAVQSLLLKGGAYGLVDDASMGRTGFPATVTLIDADRVNWSAGRGWLLDNAPVDEYPLGPLWQVPLHVMPGSPMGLNPLEFARKTIFQALVAQEFGANFFRDGGHPTTILAPDSDPGEQGARMLKDKFIAATRGNREPIVVPKSTTVHQLQINPEDSQFIDLMRFDDETLCRFFGVDPAMVGVATGGTSLTYANVTDRREDFKQFTLLLPMYRLEEAMSDLLPGDVEVKFNPAGLLRGSIKERFATYLAGAQISQTTGETFMSVGEMRDLEDWEPLPPVDDLVDARNIVEMVQKVYLGVGVVITAEEARLLLNQAGAGLDLSKELV